MSQKPTEKRQGKTELNKLFLAWEETDKAVQAAETLLAEAKAANSAAIKAIAEKAEELGFGVGPFSRGGRVLTIATRQSYETKTSDDGKEVKVPVGTPTYYFRGPKAAAIEVV